jgi:drug/metabolite transporter (DMT)-like permease
MSAFYCFYLSVKKVGVSTAATFESMYPLFVVLFAAIYFKNVPSPSFAIGALLIFIGGAIISYFN